MKLSKKAYYGLRAALALSKAQKPLSIHTLAEAESIPEDYLEKILQALRKQGVVSATRGTTGGYQLTHKNTTAFDIVTALEGPLKIYAPLDTGKLPCFQITHCQTNSIFRSLESNLETTLKNISLASLT